MADPTKNPTGNIESKLGNTEATALAIEATEPRIPCAVTERET